MRYKNLSSILFALLFSLPLLAQPLLEEDREKGGEGDPDPDRKCISCKTFKLKFETTAQIGTKELNRIEVESTLSIENPSSIVFEETQEGDIYVYRFSVTVCFPYRPCGEVSGDVGIRLVINGESLPQYYTRGRSKDTYFNSEVLGPNKNHPNYNRETSFTTFSVRNICCGEPLDDFTKNFNPNSQVIEDKVLIWPNPILDHVSIDNLNESDFVQLFDVHGKIVKSASVFNSENITLDTQDLISGIYLLQIIRNSRLVRTEKLLKK